MSNNIFRAFPTKHTENNIDHNTENTEATTGNNHHAIGQYCQVKNYRSREFKSITQIFLIRLTIPQLGNDDSYIKIT